MRPAPLRNTRTWPHARTHAPTNYVTRLCGPVGLYAPLLQRRTCARARVRACPAPLCLPSTSAFTPAAPWLVAVLIVRRATCLAFMVCTYHSKRHATTCAATHVSQNVVPGLALCCTKCGCMRRRRPLAPAKYQPCRVVSVTHDLGAVCCRNRSACFAVSVAQPQQPGQNLSSVVESRVAICSWLARFTNTAGKLPRYTAPSRKHTRPCDALALVRFAHAVQVRCVLLTRVVVTALPGSMTQPGAAPVSCAAGRL